MGVAAGNEAAAGAPFVSVIVPHYSDLARLDLCLTALERQSFPRSRFEVVVADNNSPQGREAVERVIAGRAALVVVPERGAGPARNGGVAAAKGELLAFTDSDCTPQPGWLAAGIEALDRCDFVGGAVQVLVEEPSAPTPTEAFEVVFAFDNERYVTRMGFTITANLFCPRRLFEAVGGFRVGVSEDLEWSHRARAAGYRIGYEARAAVGHPARTTWDELVRKWRRINLETFGLQRPGAMRTLKWTARNLLMPASAVAQTPRVIFDRRLPNWRARLGALAVLYRLRVWRLFDALRLLAPVRAD